MSAAPLPTSSPLTGERSLADLPPELLHAIILPPTDALFPDFTPAARLSASCRHLHTHLPASMFIGHFVRHVAYVASKAGREKWDSQNESEYESDKDSDVDERDEPPSSPEELIQQRLECILRAGSVDILSYLRNAGLWKIMSSDFTFDEVTYMKASIESKRLEVVKILHQDLLEVGCFPEPSKDIVGDYAVVGDYALCLRTALEVKHMESAEYFLGHLRHLSVLKRAEAASAPAPYMVGIFEDWEDYFQKPLEDAARMGWHDLLQLCSEQGLSLDMFKFGGGPLFSAAAAGRVDTVRFILDHKISPVNPDHALAGAAVSGSIEIAELALEHGAQVDYFFDGRINGRKINGRTPLQIAAKSGHIDLVKELIEKWGADLHLGPGPDLPDLTDQALVEASQHGHAAVVTYLLAKGAQVNRHHPGIKPPKDNYLIEEEPTLTALAAAIEGGHVDIVRILLKAGARVHDYDDCALRKAARLGLVEAVILLLDAGANVNPSGVKPEKTPVTLAFRTGNKTLIRTLLNRGAEINIYALRNAIRFGVDMVELLLDSNGPFDMEKFYRDNPMEKVTYTPLREAVAYPDVLALLIHKYKADLGVEGPGALDCALGTATESNGPVDGKAIRILLDAGVDVRVRGRWLGQEILIRTPAEWVEDERLVRNLPKDVLEQLRERIAKLELSRDKGVQW